MIQFNLLDTVRVPRILSF